MKELSKIILICSFFMLISANAHSSNKELSISDTTELNPRFGIYGNVGLMLYGVDSLQLPNIPNCCQGYTTGEGSGYDVGALVEYPLNFDLMLYLRAGYSDFNSKLVQQERTTVIIDTAEALGMFEHRLNGYFSNINLSLGTNYRLWERLFLGAGIEMAFKSKAEFDQIEVIVAPEDRGTYPNGTREQNFYSGDIEPAQAMLFGIGTQLSYELPLNAKGTLWLAPELGFRMFFDDLVDDPSVKWTASSLKAGLSLKWREGAPPPPPPPPPMMPPYLEDLKLPETPPMLTVDIEIQQISEDGNQSKDVQLKIEDFVTTNMRPLLNYVFFDEGSSDLPSRYVTLDSNQVKDYSEKAVGALDPIKTYYQMLNIIGNRLKQYPNIKVTLVGCNSNFGVEKNNKKLSQSRATTVRNYFRDVWGIDEKRMKIVARNLPVEKSRSDEQTGREENMRVEILTKDAELTEPVLTTDTLTTINSTSVKLTPKIDAPTGISEMNIEIMQGENSLFSYKSDEIPPQDIIWKIEPNSPNSPTKSKYPITYYISATDKLGQTVMSDTRTINLETITVDKKRESGTKDTEYEYYSLILFDYGKAKLGSEHRKVVDFVKNRISNDSKIQITGHTDSMGESEVNKVISTKRAKAVSERLNIQNAEWLGIGEDGLIYDNSTPEGRFYCRTVKINIETPVK